MKTIRVKIRKDNAQLTIETSGFEGANCLEATKKLEEGLGLKEPERTLKDEYYQSSQDNQEVGGS